MPTDATSLKVLKEALDKWWDVGIKKDEAQAAKEADISKLLLERTIGAEAGKKANREMFQIAKKGKGKLQRKQYTRAEGTTIQPPGAKIDPDTGVPYSRVQLNIGKTKPAPHSKIHGKLELDLEAQDFNYIESFLERNTGNIYKPASWRGQNTKGNCIRGSIYEKESFKNADRFGGWLYLESSNGARWHR